MTLRPLELSGRARWGALAAASALLVTLLWQGALAPARARLATGERQAAELATTLARARAGAAQLPQLERDGRALHASLREAGTRAAGEDHPAIVLQRVHALAAASDLELTGFTPKPGVRRDLYVEWPIQLELEGGYHALGRFLDALSSMPAPISVGDLQVRAKTGSSSVTISASCTATIFVLTGAAGAPLGGSSRRTSAVAPERLPIGTPVGSAIKVAPIAADGYDAGGRRDPFEPLIPRKHPGDPPARPGGRAAVALREVAVADVAVTGILRSGSTTVALLEAPGGKSFVAHREDRLRDARVQGIEPDAVLFAQEATDGRRAIRKPIRVPAAEVGR